MCDPDAGARAHHRLQRRDETARRTLNANPLVRLDVDVRLAIGYRNDVVAAKLAAQRRTQRLLRPDAAVAVLRPVLALQLTHELAHIARKRTKLGRCDHACGL